MPIWAQLLGVFVVGVLAGICLLKINRRELP